MTPKRSLGLRALAAALEAVVQRHRAGARAPAHVGRVVLDVAHALDAAGEHDVGGAGLHHHRRVDDGLQAAAAAAVELHAGHVDRQAGLQRDPAADAGRLAVGVATARRRRRRCARGSMPVRSTTPSRTAARRAARRGRQRRLPPKVPTGGAQPSATIAGATHGPRRQTGSQLNTSAERSSGRSGLQRRHARARPPSAASSPRRDAPSAAGAAGSSGRSRCCAPRRSAPLTSCRGVAEQVDRQRRDLGRRHLLELLDARLPARACRSGSSRSCGSRRTARCSWSAR